MHCRIHGVGTACGKMLAINPDSDALAEQPSHLHLT